MASFQARVIGAMKLQVSTFEDVEHDATATAQAATLVLAVGVASGLGSIAWMGVTGLLTSAVLGLLGWVIGAAVLWAVGTKLLPGRNTEADIGQLLRTVGFAEAPGLFSVFGLIPVLGGVVRLVVAVWSLVALVIAVRQALDYESTLRAVIVCVIAWAIMLFVMLISGGLGLGAPGPGSRVF
jgi:hypothetical protein